MDTIACHLPTSDHTIYCHDETTADTYLIIGERKVILNNVHHVFISQTKQDAGLQTDLPFTFVSLVLPDSYQARNEVNKVACLVCSHSTSL